jgi:hypothetical protein
MRVLTTAPTGTITGTAGVSLNEARHYLTKQTSDENFLWSVRASGIDRSTVAAVHVHERDTNLLLFQSPIENTNAPADVITQTFTVRPHNGATSSTRTAPDWDFSFFASRPRHTRSS